MPNWNMRLLKEIAHLRHLQEDLKVNNEHISHQLHILRHVRNTELGLTSDQGRKVEDSYILQQKLIEHFSYVWCANKSNKFITCI
ncbi:hypothetical protein [Lysinibacillus sphaericus]|uniref:hypothetical protein n=1 Tax=Lysinibacillus sphaericus TaxID=1421 RepID=UPI0018CFDFAB|nr:hypothetical protein [Lysinibacillus sphaericus]